MAIDKRVRNDEAVRAAALVGQALKSGQLVRPMRCELCGVAGGFPSETHKIITHHWNGYGHPLDVWWLCYQCSGKLKGERFHGGTVTKDEAMEFVLNFQIAKRQA
jgi:hypothetical protein